MDYLLLQNAALFKQITVDEIHELLSGLQYHVKKYRAESLIAQAGEPVKSLQIVLSGTVKGEMVDYSGRIIKIEEIHAPDAVAAAFLFGNRNRYPVNIVSVTNSEILFIDTPDFLKLMKRSDRILVNFLDIVSNRSQFLTEKIRFLNFKTLKSKLAQYILLLSDGKTGCIKLDRTQNDLADYFGVARPSVGRAINEMESEGLILAKSKTITILDKEGLAGLTTG